MVMGKIAYKELSILSIVKKITWYMLVVSRIVLFIEVVLIRSISYLLLYYLLLTTYL